MKSFRVRGVTRATGTIQLPGDKSISHRAALLAAVAHGTSTLHHYLMADDCVRTLECLRLLGIDWKIQGDQVQIEGKGLDGLQPPTTPLDVGNSGTTIRLLTGMLAGQRFTSVITGDDSIRHRPMKRVMEPLRQMGARIQAATDDNFAPLTVQGSTLKPIQYELPVASAQVKSAVLLAGLYVDGRTQVREPIPTRDHTERLLQWFGIPVQNVSGTIQVSGRVSFQGKDVQIAGDTSSAAFLVALGLLMPEGRVRATRVGINPLRVAYLKLLQKAGGRIEIRERGEISAEPVGDIEVLPSKLRAFTLGGNAIASLIDEIPILAVVGALSEGVSEIRDALELRVKESDRIAAVVGLLESFGVPVEERVDGMRIHGVKQLKGAHVESQGDHRIAMAAAVAGLLARGETVVENVECVDTSFPTFVGCVQDLCGVDAIEVVGE